VSPETDSRYASAVLITKYEGDIFDNCFAAKAQQHLEFPLSAALCPVPPTRVNFIPLTNIGGTHFRNDKPYNYARDIFGRFVNQQPTPALAALIWPPG
jgi:hypothetical protein